MMASSTNECSLCLCTVQSHHSTILFSANRLHSDWPKRIHKLLGVELVNDAGLPGHMCRSCKGKVLSLEDKVNKMRTLVEESLTKLKERQSGGRKRSKRHQWWSWCIASHTKSSSSGQASSTCHSQENLVLH